jgi:predicted transcriptional regulator
MQKEMTTTKNSRSRSEIAIQILEAVNNHGEDHIDVTRTTLMDEIFLNSNQLNEYLAALTAYDLLHYDTTQLTYCTTKKGLRFLDLWYNMRNRVNEQLLLLQPKTNNYQ